MRPLLVVRVGQGHAKAELRRGARVLWAAEAEFATPGELREAIVHLVASESLPARPGRLRVEVEAPLAQVRTLHDLPPVRAGHLQALVATQSGRFFRRNGKPLVTAAVWHDRRSGGQALAAAVEEPWVQAILDGAEAGRVSVETIRPANVPPQARLELLPASERRRRRRKQFLTLRWLGGAAALAWSLAGALFALRLETARRAVEREIDGLRKPVDAVLTGRRALGEAAHMVETLAGEAQDRGRMLGRLAAISAALPDSAYVTSLVVEASGGGEMTVVARRPSQVVGTLDRVPGIVSPRVQGTVMREQHAGREWERFTVRFEGGGR